MYLYESHLGGLFTSEHELDYEILYCEQCGDSDNELGYFTTLQELWNLIKDDCAIDNEHGGFAMQYIYPFLCGNFQEYLHKPIRDEYDSSWCTESNETLLNYIKDGIQKEKEKNNDARANQRSN